MTLSLPEEADSGIRDRVFDVTLENLKSKWTGLIGTIHGQK